MSAWLRSQTPSPDLGGQGASSRVIDRWIYTACLCFGLNIDGQQQSRFVYDYSIYQVEYSRNWCSPRAR
jgi:hypothetical protein